MLRAGKSQKKRETGTMSFFAPAGRAPEQLLRQEIELISKNAVIDTVMQSVGGLLAVLNEQRQILAVNDSLMEILNLDDPQSVFGMRPGEALQCIHAHEQAGGCGTSRYCTTCGAAIAIVSSLDTNQPAQKDCMATIEKSGKEMDLYFQVRSFPVEISGMRFLLLFMRDVTIQHQQAALERTFFHDIKNIIVGLSLNTQLLATGEQNQRSPALARRIINVTDRLQREIEIQRVLSFGEQADYQLLRQSISVREIIQGVEEVLAHHPVSANKELKLEGVLPEINLITDVTLLLRVLTNMLINAFEATEEEETVRMWVEEKPQTVTFHVWNRKVIPEEIALRIFQRNFSTKEGSGRGLGTYAMKLFGETYLGGSIDFTSTADEGTVFRLALPRQEQEKLTHSKRAPDKGPQGQK